ncbi:hypothetical protein SmJEL517_g05482 [Synchytrium microbalum]|uniref:Tetratricopeptide repeat protein 21B n=1 Tax=Synchytrium microbalum TaxID=1806994 RepID=A0A507BL05_9FUNG|nr:uncharacterized protein SmJEL517_g05482 [Synchytrium microbalum]TPX31100.1 hypothetical protein SmJEL517_g05482 [Synchytrium microbalum]
MEEDTSLVHYYCRKGWFHHVKTICDLALKRRMGDPLLLFWKAFSLLSCRKPVEAIRDLLPLLEKRDLVLAAPAALIHAHRQCQTIDHEAIDELQAKLTIASSSTNLSDRAHIHVALFYLYIGDTDHAKQHVKSALDIANSALALTAMGWIELKRAASRPAQSNWFDRALEVDSFAVDALMGKMDFLCKVRNQLEVALDLAAQITVKLPTFLPAHIERMWILLGMEAWDQMLEASTIVLTMAPDNIDALLAAALHQVCREGNLKTVVEQLTQLNQVIAKVEPSNSSLLLSTSRAFSRLASRHAGILQQCYIMIERALKLDPSSSIWAEMGYLQILRGISSAGFALLSSITARVWNGANHFDIVGNVASAKDAYQTSSNLDSHNFDALQGLIHCQLLDGDYGSAGEQLELCNELQATLGHSSYIAYLTSLYSWLAYRDSESRIKSLDEVVELQRQKAETIQPSVSFFIHINCDLLMEVARDFMEMAPSDPKAGHPSLRSAEALLSFVTRLLPACSAAVLLQATAQYLSQQSSTAMSTLVALLKQDQSSPKAHLLMARIQIQLKKYDQALQSCEMALAGGFEVRGWLSWNYLRGKALSGQGRYEEAITAFSAALSVVSKGVDSKSKGLQASSEGVLASDRVNVFLELVDCHGKLNHQEEATRLMQDAQRLFSSSMDGSRFTLASAELAIQREDYDKAIELLSTIPPTHNTFVDAKTRMAEIYLKFNHNNQMYVKCFGDIVEHSPSAENSICLGDAYMTISEYEKAIAIYESALQSYPEARELASKVGYALVKTHRYQKAIAYYESALEGATDIPLMIDLADLHRRLGQFDEAERIVHKCLDGQDASGRAADVALHQNIKLNLLLARIYHDTSNLPSAFTYLSRARDLQLRAVSGGGSTATSDQLRVGCGDICHQLGEVALAMNDSDAAKDFWTQALQMNSASRQSLICLIKLCMSQTDLGNAHSYLNSLLKLNPDDPEAAVLVADVSLRRGAFDHAITHYRELLERQPQNYMALERFIEVSRRAGMLGEAAKAITIVEDRRKKVIGTASTAGLRFCKGLHARYINNANLALREFNACRRDLVWGERAISAMVEIFLNPDNEILGGEALNAVREAQEPGAETDDSDSDLLAVLTADKLLKELPQNPKSVKTRVLECYALMGTRHKSECELAVARLTDVLNDNPDHVPSLLGQAIAYMHLKQPPRARNQLKRIAKLDWTSELGDEFERSWLLLADIYIQGGKFDLATELVKRVLKHNMSSLRAYELLGHIMEKEASYRDASDQYERAWQLCNHNSAATGYRLAFNYLKAKRYVEAIEVCLKILEKDAEYPKVKKDILEKARAALRP